LSVELKRTYPFSFSENSWKKRRQIILIAIVIENLIQNSSSLETWLGPSASQHRRQHTIPN
jgi:hypothetical protein